MFPPFPQDCQLCQPSKIVGQVYGNIQSFENLTTSKRIALLVTQIENRCLANASQTGKLSLGERPLCDGV
jgi:hypothetical protein